MNRVQMFSIAASFAAASSALAGTVSELNVVFDSARAEVKSGAFPRNPSPGTFSSINGTVSLSAKASTTMSIIKDGSKQAPTSTVNSIVAHFDITNGDVSGGSFLVTMNDATSFSCDADPRALAGTDLVWSGGSAGSYRVDGDINNFLLSGILLAGVDVQVFFDNQPLSGSFFNFAFRPDTVDGLPGSVDPTTQLGFVVATSTETIPLPAPVAMTGLGLLGLACTRRRPVR